MPNLVMVTPHLSHVAAAKREGFRVAAIWDPTLSVAPPKGTPDLGTYLAEIEELSDEFVRADFSDPTKLERALRETAHRFQADYLYHVGRESTMLVVYRIAEDLGVAVNPAATIEAINDKYVMRRTLAEHGISPVQFALADHWRDIPRVLGEFTLPVVVKPTTLAAGRGVLLVRDPGELTGYGDLLTRYGYDGPVLVEEFLRGTEYTVETVSSGGEHYVAGVGEKWLGLPPLFVDMGFIVPMPETPKIRAIGESVVELLRVTGYRCGPANTEVIWTEDGPRIVESQARFAGDNMPRMLQMTTGFDLETATFQALAGKPIMRKTRNEIAGIAYFAFQSGLLRSVSGLAEVSALDCVAELDFPFQVGDELPTPRDSATRHGHAIVLGPTVEEVRRCLDQVQSLVSAEVETSPVFAPRRTAGQR